MKIRRMKIHHFGVVRESDTSSNHGPGIRVYALRDVTKCYLSLCALVSRHKKYK